MLTIGHALSRKTTQSRVLLAKKWGPLGWAACPRAEPRVRAYPRGRVPVESLNQGSGKSMFAVYCSLLPLSRDQGNGSLKPVTPSRDGSVYDWGFSP